MSLRALDDRWLPRAATRLRAVVERLTALQHWMVRTARSFDPRKLDDRWARGPLARLRDRPQIAVVLVVLVLLAGVGAAAMGERGTEPKAQVAGRTDTGPSNDGIGGASLGPVVGVNVNDYIRAATQGLVTAVQSSPDKTRAALVSLTDYRTPEQAHALLNGFKVERVFLRAKAAGAQAMLLPVDVQGNLLVALRKTYADTALSRRVAQKSYQTYVDTLSGTGPEDTNFQGLYAAFAKAAGIEAQEYANNCACVYATLVTATPGQLLTLRARPGVRAVEVAPAALTVREVQVLPLLPEVVDTVPRPSIGQKP